ncbi:Spy/CpxP family protein refolding chaperone [Desulfonema magnum]|uniref:Metal-binding domain-containing protein n=1 Tax=Desulfonema magnum TaxID=45655 RepID=A0A975BS71_9BACT|nr:Spy/CpxP family protein refolding chaperone [Desulfonema magnum]QTA90467.1 Metal-binding domain-containing protein [Desulfonema magnum]
MKAMKTLSMVLVLVMLFSGAAMAGKFGKHHHGFGMDGGFMGFRGLIRQLDLSEAQKTEVANVLTKYRDNIRNTADSLAETRGNMNTVMLTEEFNEANLREAFQKAASLQEDFFVLRAKIFSEIKPLLTPEQLELLKQKKAEMTEKMKARMNFRHSKFDAWLESHGE